jgi:hypothetical protein
MAGGYFFDSSDRSGADLRCNMGIGQSRPGLRAVWIRGVLSVKNLKLVSQSAPQPRVTEEERRRAEEDQARLDRICLFLKERRRRRRRRVVAVTTVTAGLLLLAAGAGWHLRDRGNKATSVAPDSSPAVTQPIASPAPIEKTRAENDGAATRLPTAPSVSREQKPAVKPSVSARAPSKAVRQTQAPVPPPKFLDRPQAPRETPIMRPVDQPAPASANWPARMEGSSPARKVAPPPKDSPVDTRRNSGVESP